MIGPRRAKEDLLAEARDGLIDAAEAYAVAGLPAPEATARALADFGGYRQVAADYQAELAAAQGRRTALLVAVVMPTMLLLSRFMWTGSPWTRSGPAPGSGYLLVSYTLDILQVTAAIMALLTLLGYGWGSRYLPAARVPAAVLLTRLMGVGVLVFIAIEALTGFVIYAWSVRMWPVAADWPPLMVGAVLVPLILFAIGRSGVRCVRSSGGASVPRLG
nr:permease prefix domain 1-containing protein [Planosporangium mesophilum]